MSFTQEDIEMASVELKISQLQKSLEETNAKCSVMETKINEICDYLKEKGQRRPLHKHVNFNSDVCSGRPECWCKECNKY